jgi:Methyltransferase domain
MADGDFSYGGHEFAIFAQARIWKSYWGAYVDPFVRRGRVLEVGAGLGANTSALCHPAVSRWVCLEPDARLAHSLQTMLGGSMKYLNYEARCGTIDRLGRDDIFDAILYLDVLEHIKLDRAELQLVSTHLDSHGALVVLAPAHQWLFSAFDAAVGHFRRYDRKTLEASIPDGLRRELLIYLDSAGLLASLANRCLLRNAYPSRRQILFWDRVLVRCSMRVDPVFGHRLGKSLLGVWRKI